MIFSCYQIICNGKHQIVTLSTWMVLAAVIQESKFWIQLLKSMINPGLFNWTPAHCDNHDDFALVKNPIKHQRLKYINIRYDIIRSKEQKGIIQFVHVSSERNVADIFIKFVIGVKLKTGFSSGQW